jgi:hypothetical protein
MGYRLYKLFNSSVRLIPASVLRHLMNTLHRHPDISDRVGYQVYPHAFYNPFPEPGEVDLARLKEPRSLPGLRIDQARVLGLFQELTAYAPEISEFINGRPKDLVRYWNETYPGGDSATLYAMLRNIKPKRYIEVGCGYSSRTSSAALRRNAAEGHACQTVYIDPYPAAHLAGVQLPGEFIRQKVQQVPVARFQELEAGDVLFLDTSHVIKVQNDVEYEFLRILPTLKPGVIVHVHDIFTPYDYPQEWLLGTGPNRGGVNEQYALECLLSGGREWEVILPVHLVWRDHRPQMDRLVDIPGRPAAFWIRKLG